MTTKRLHYLSGLIITVFVGLHLINHLCGIFGADRHIAVMNALRPVYRNAVSETILLSIVFVQIFSGLALFRSGRKAAATRFEKLHVWTGLYLALFLVIHVGAVLVGRLFLHLDTNFYFGAAGINSFPFNLFFVPYYGLAVLSFFGHLASIHSKKMRRDILTLSPGKQAAAILLLGLVVTAAIFYGLTNHFHGVQIPQAYDVLVGK